MQNTWIRKSCLPRLESFEKRIRNLAGNETSCCEKRRTAWMIGLFPAFLGQNRFPDGNAKSSDEDDGNDGWRRIEPEVKHLESLCLRHRTFKSPRAFWGWTSPDVDDERLAIIQATRLGTNGDNLIVRPLFSLWCVKRNDGLFDVQVEFHLWMGSPPMDNRKTRKRSLRNSIGFYAWFRVIQWNSVWYVPGTWKPDQRLASSQKAHQEWPEPDLKPIFG